MPQPPKWLLDAGVLAIVLFFFVATVNLIYKIILAAKGKTAETTNGNGRRLPCIQTPQLQAIMTNQVVTMEAMKRMEKGGEDLARNLILQTQLMERVADVQEKICDCVLQMAAREKVRDETRVFQRPKG